MTTPVPAVQVVEQGQGYLFTWPDLSISIKVSRIQAHISDGRVTGELLVQSLNEAGKVINIFPPTSFNFSAARTRTELRNSLLAKYPKFPWGEMLDQLCFGVQDRVARGELVQELWTNADVKPPEWLIKPILYRGLPTIIYGEKAVAKSTMALVIYTCLLLGWADNPLGWEVPRRSIPALLADYEVDGDVAQYNAKQLQIGLGLPAFPLYYRRATIPLADDIEQLQQHLTRLKAEVLIVDSLGPAVGGDLSDPATALRFSQSLRLLKCATIIIGQTSKDKRAKNKTVFGSTFFEYYARNIFELRKAQEEGEDEFDIALFNTYNNLSKRVRPQGFHLSFNGTGTHIESQPITAQELIEHFGTQEKVRRLLLKEGPMNAEKIAQALDLKESHIRVELSRLSRKGIIVSPKRGLYAVKAFEE